MPKKTKKCSRCQKTKLLSKFHFANKGTQRRQGNCKICAKEALREHYRRMSSEDLRRQNLQRYGITLEDYESMLTQQGGGCVICGGRRGNKKTNVLHVDHDHVTGEVRGLLCGRCNTALGLFQDQPDLLKRAYDYLNRNKSA